MGSNERTSERERENHNGREREWRIKMAHNLAPSVNCSLDDIDLNALKVRIDMRIIRRAFFVSSSSFWSREARIAPAAARRRFAAAVLWTRLVSRACRVPLVINLARTDDDDDEKRRRRRRRN